MSFLLEIRNDLFFVIWVWCVLFLLGVILWVMLIIIIQKVFDYFSLSYMGSKRSDVANMNVSGAGGAGGSGNPKKRKRWLFILILILTFSLCALFWLIYFKLEEQSRVNVIEQLPMQKDFVSRSVYRSGEPGFYPSYDTIFYKLGVLCLKDSFLGTYSDLPNGIYIEVGEIWYTRTGLVEHSYVWLDVLLDWVYRIDCSSIEKQAISEVWIKWYNKRQYGSDVFYAIRIDDFFKELENHTVGLGESISKNWGYKFNWK